MLNKSFAAQGTLNESVIPLFGYVDVIVVGGGVAGVSAQQIFRARGINC